MTSVAFSVREMPHYRVGFFNQLAERLADHDISMTVFAGTARRDNAIKQSFENLRSGKFVRNRYLTDEIYWQPVFSELRKFDVVVVVQANAALLNFPLLLYRSLFGAPPLIALWGHGANMQQSGKAAFRDWVKGMATRAADHCFAYTEVSRERFLEIGVPDSRITVVNNSLDISEISSARFEAAERGVAADAVPNARAVFCSRLYEAKALPFLVDACRLVHGRIPGFELVIVGDGPLRPWLEEIARKEPWLKVPGPRYGRDLARILVESDVFLLPAHVGLSILDGFAAGLPVVTADFGNHSPEIAYLDPGRNGLMTECYPESYAEGIVQILSDDSLRHDMGAVALETASNYSVSAMAGHFADGLMHMLGKNPVESG